MNIKQIRLRQASIMRKIRRANRKTKARNKQVRKKTYRSPKQKQSFTKPPIEVKAPKEFSLNNLDRVVQFINDTENRCGKEISKSLKVNLDEVEQIDSYAISLMLSMLNRLSHKQINFWGTYPASLTAKRFILESGFLDVMRTNIRKPANERKGNQIFMVGKDSVDSHRIGRAVRESMEFITGKEGPYPPIYDNMLEICANSVEHANLKTPDKNWLVSISFEDNNIHYILTDTGLGILSTLKKKGSQKLKEIVTSKTDAEILYDVFHKAYQSVTGEINRHKGLPIILESFAEGHVSSLKVLTNKVFYDFETNTSKELKYGFKGVLYSWTVSRNNYDNWLKSL